MNGYTSTTNAQYIKTSVQIDTYLVKASASTCGRYVSVVPESTITPLSPLTRGSSKRLVLFLVSLVVDAEDTSLPFAAGL